MNTEEMHSEDVIYAFLDTNTLIQFQMFNEVDWPKLLGAKEVVLVLDDTVQGELDKFKDDGTNLGRRDRVRNIQSVFKRYIKSGKQTDPVLIRPNVSLLALFTSPMVDWIAEELDRTVADDRLVASMIQFSNKVIRNNILLVSNDSRPRHKAEGRDFGAFDPEGSIPLVELTSQVEKELRRVKADYEALKSAIPRLSVSFADTEPPGNLIHFDRLEGRSVTWNPKDFEAEADEIRRSYRRAAPFANNYYEFYEHHFAMVDYYIEQLGAFRYQEWVLNQAWLIDIDFTATNFGKAAAHNVDVEIGSSNIVAVYAADDLPDWFSEDQRLELPVAPTAPGTPTKEKLAAFYLRQQQAERDRALISSLYTPPPMPVDQGRSGYPESWEESGKIIADIPNLKAGKSWTTDKFLLVLQPNEAGTVTLNYSVHSDELREEVSGSLVMRFGNKNP